MESKDIIKNIYAQWLVAKEQRRQKCETANMHEVARKLAACDMFKGTEDIAGLAALFKTPQGVEFCLAANFPNLATFRLLTRFDPRCFGFYIDAGNVRLKNPETAVLIGKTYATIECDTCTQHTVIAMHGATATVLASGWAVVRTEAGASASIIRRTSDNAIIL